MAEKWIDSPMEKETVSSFSQIKKNASEQQKTGRYIYRDCTVEICRVDCTLLTYYLCF